MKEFSAKGMVAALAALGAWLFGALDQAMLIFLTVMILDYLTGVTSATVNKELNSQRGLKGIAKKVGMLALIVLAHLTSTLLGTPAIRLAIIFFLIANEALSIIENISELGVGVPDWFKEILERLKESKPDA